MPPCGAVSPFAVGSVTGPSISTSLSPVLVVVSFIVDFTSAVDFPVITATLCSSGVLTDRFVVPLVLLLIVAADDDGRLSVF